MRADLVESLVGRNGKRALKIRLKTVARLGEIMTSKHGPDSWERLAAVVRIVREVAGSSGPLGKKKLQKLVHLAQDAGEIPTKYRFSFYTYGAFSAELAADIDRLDYWRALSVTYDPSSNAYSITPTDDARELEVRGANFLKAIEHDLSGVIRDFGSRSPRELELLSTLIFIKRHSGLEDDAAIVDQAVDLKPHFSDVDARKGIDQLSELGYWK